MTKITCEHSGIEFEDGKGWISVKERLPKENGRYLVYLIYPAHLVYENEPCGYISIYSFKNDKFQSSFVTHWMEMPQPPEIKS